MNNIKFYWLILGLIFVVCFVMLRFGVGIPYDDTDNVAKGERSGFELRTDHGTGCQYLVRPSAFGGDSITPRLDRNGKPICGRGNR